MIPCAINITDSLGKSKPEIATYYIFVNYAHDYVNEFM
jgi:hypothetical protein